MDRALDLTKLTNALGTHTLLPSPADLQRLLADTEIALFARQAEIGDGLLDAAWYLQSVATARDDLQLFSVDRRRLAHQVSAHIFDLALQASSLDLGERLRYIFAAQVGYLGGELTPNAAALARRAPLSMPPYEWPGPGVASMEAGVLLLALNRRDIYPLLQARRRQMSQFSSRLGDLSVTAYAAADGVITGAWELTNYLTYGTSAARERAMERFRSAMASEPAGEDVDSRWVAAHLYAIADAVGTASVWSVLPPETPSAARAMTLGDPPVLLLWPPQLSFLESNSDRVSPLDPSVTRMVLSFPTSAGKSLLAQLFVITHLLSGSGDVCVVAPTHSLCRELATGLERRLRTLGYELHEDGPLGDFGAKPPTARVVVMTPEKLAARLRSDPEALLGEFGMFVVDEAHLVGDGGRGWKLEETISFLHHLTRATAHRLLVLSAALGNQVHVVAWLNDGSNVVSKHETWRGPRRLNVVFSTEPDWDQEEQVPGEGARQPRRRIPLMGLLRLKAPGGSQPWVSRAFTEPVGHLVLRRKIDGQWIRDAQLSARQREQLTPLIAHVAASGPVLVVEATRPEAQKLADEVAENIGEGYPSPFALIDAVASRLGPDHALARVLAKGVAYHHSALPSDIQAEIEDAVRNGDIRCLVATTTLTEGVNLPFKTVIVAHRGYRGADGVVELVDAPRLLNAIGRAGRAGRETEGWLILSELSSDFEAGMFEELERSGADVDVRSTLATSAALEALQNLEVAANSDADAILSNQGAIADGFISYVWFIADALEELRGTVTASAVAAAIEDTLAWHQLDEEGKERLERVANIAFERYSDQPTERRRRWARAGTSLPTAAILDAVSEEVLQARLGEAEQLGVSDALDLILGQGRLTRILNLAENTRKGFKPHRTAPRDQLVAVDIGALLGGWVAGQELQDLADNYLTEISVPEYRYDQLSEFVASVFEHHLPWTLGIVIAWVNQRLEAAGTQVRLPEELPGLVHFGVRSSDALGLMLAGVRSRRLASRVADTYKDEVDPGSQGTLREWLAQQEISAWRERFDASPTELFDLLAYTRAPETRLVSQVLGGEGYKLPFVSTGPADDGAEAAIGTAPNEPQPASLVVIVDGNVVGRIGPEHYDDIALLRDIGIPLSARVEVTGGQPRLDLRTASE